MGGSLGKNKSESTQYPSKVWDVQSPYLQDIYSRAQSFRPTSQAQLGGFQYDPSQVSNVVSGAMPGLQNQLGGGFQNKQLGSNLQGIAGGQFQNQELMNNLRGLGSGEYQNQALGGAIQAGLGDINRNLKRNLLPTINTGAAMTNTSGGSRQGIAQGLAVSDANRQAGDFVNKMRSQNYGQNLQSMLAANQQMGGLQGQQLQAMLGANQQLGGLQAQQNLAQAGALGQVPGMAGIGMANQAAQQQSLIAVVQPG